MFVIPHSYYAVTDETGRFEFTDVPPGTYQIAAWHEGWMLSKVNAFDVSSGVSVHRCRSCMTIVITVASYFACANSATTVASLSSIWFQPST